ncbi:MAG: hypothetical protein WCD89_10375 [Anaerocolumna sp.]
MYNKLCIQLALSRLNVNLEYLKALPFEELNNLTKEVNKIVKKN